MSAYKQDFITDFLFNNEGAPGMDAPTTNVIPPAKINKEFNGILKSLQWLNKHFRELELNENRSAVDVRKSCAAIISYAQKVIETAQGIQDARGINELSGRMKREAEEPHITYHHLTPRHADHPDDEETRRQYNEAAERRKKFNKNYEYQQDLEKDGREPGLGTTYTKIPGTGV